MNRLVIIGNGFDLAHGLPTGYCDFIDDYWRNFIKSYGNSYQSLYSDDFAEFFFEFKWEDINPLRKRFHDINCYKKLNEFIASYNESIHHYQPNDRKPSSLNFKNDFFKNICELHSIQNWVDVENEYYIVLKKCLNSDDNLAIIELNKQFNNVKLLFEEYLIKNIEEKFEFSNLENNELSKIFNENYYNTSNLPSFLVQFSGNTIKYFQNFFNEQRNNIIDQSAKKLYEENISINTSFLSFNYTPTASNYSKQLKSRPQLNEIHGKIGDERNPTNFGFGDEMDKHYQEIEEKNDNEYLRNIKSFQYLNNSNYKRLLDLIDSEKFQVYIMGHSCGLSDRTLLNTIFEHENCISIKIFYHEILDEEGNYVKDNYTEITQNISRHFNKKKLMREKIVNKTLCYPLPQIQLPKKENQA